MFQKKGDNVSTHKLPHSANYLCTNYRQNNVLYAALATVLLPCCHQPFILSVIQPNTINSKRHPIQANIHHPIDSFVCLIYQSLSLLLCFRLNGTLSCQVVCSCPMIMMMRLPFHRAQHKSHYRKVKLKKVTDSNVRVTSKSFALYSLLARWYCVVNMSRFWGTFLLFFIVFSSCLFC